MSTRNYHYLCVHGHFYQPPRGNPVTGEIGVEAEADPYQNWNERITAEAYKPNAQVGNFARMSFDVGETLMHWLETNETDTYKWIVEADQSHQQSHQVGNALGSPYHHSILPLARLRDKRTEIFWGKAAFQHHFGHEPQGMWLPEMAFDLETLQTIRTAGYTYTILSQGQIEEGIDGGPYLLDLQNGETLSVFIRNNDLSNDLSFNIDHVGGAGHWARNRLGNRRDRSDLTLIATDGETFGHHHLGEEQFVKWLLENEASTVGYKVVTLNQYLQEFPATEMVTPKMFSSWSCYHGVDRWVTGCACTPGNSSWKGALRRALDNLTGDLDDLYMDELRPYGVNAWMLRDEYIRVLMGEISGSAFLAQYITGLKTAEENRLLNLLKSQAQILRAYTSCAFFFEDFDRPEPRYSVGNALYAIQLANEASGQELGKRFRNELVLARSERSPLNGAQVYDSLMEDYFRPKLETVDGESEHSHEGTE